jgi:hypothetical protein
MPILELAECKTDDNGNIVYEKYFNGDECWYGAANRNLVYFKSHLGTERWYNANGNLTYEKVPNGYGEWYESWYDNKGNLVRRRYMIDETKWSPWENYDTYTHRPPTEIGVEYGIVVE